MKLVYMIPFYISDTDKDRKLARDCFDSLDLSDDVEVVISNQGYMTNDEIHEFMKNYKMKYHIIGVGENVGIPLSRYKSLEYIFNLPYEIDYIGEIHIDMILPPNWHKPLTDYLDNSDEPMLCVRTLGFDVLPEKLEDKIKYLQNETFDDVSEGFVHPVIHKAKILKEINPYDVGYFVGKQGYEDDAILLGYSYYLGTGKKWRPKAMSNSCVAHLGAAQRFLLAGKQAEFDKNLNGLNAMYGGMGFKELYRLHNKNEIFYGIYQQTILDKDAYNYDINKESIPVDTSNILTSRFIVKDDPQTSKCILDLPIQWLSRRYEYEWAMNFVNEKEVVLDAGCGCEHPFKFYLASKSNHVFACDVDENIKNKKLVLDSVEKVFGHDSRIIAEPYASNIILLKQNLGYLNYGESSFDKVFCIDILHQMDQEGQKIVLENLYRMLKPHGLLIMTFMLPYVNLEYICSLVNSIGFSYLESLDKNIPNNIFTFEQNNITVFRMILKK